MAVSLENKRRSVTLPEVVWAELEAEAEEGKVTVSEVLLRYITEARMTPDSAYVKMERRLDQFAYELGASGSQAMNVLTLLEVFIRDWQKQSATARLDTPSGVTIQRQALLDWYAENRVAPDEAHVETTRVLSPSSHWLTRLRRWAFYA